MTTHFSEIINPWHSMRVVLICYNNENLYKDGSHTHSLQENPEPIHSHEL